MTCDSVGAGDQAKDDLQQFIAGLDTADVAVEGRLGKRIGCAQHRPQAGRGKATRSCERCENVTAFLDERVLIRTLHLQQFRRTPQRGNHGGDLLSLRQHTLHIAGRHHLRLLLQGGTRGVHGGVEQACLPDIVVLVQCRQQSIACAEMIVGDRLGDTGGFSEPNLFYRFEKP